MTSIPTDEQNKVALKHGDVVRVDGVDQQVVVRGLFYNDWARSAGMPEKRVEEDGAFLTPKGSFPYPAGDIKHLSPGQVVRIEPFGEFIIEARSEDDIANPLTPVTGSHATKTASLKVADMQLATLLRDRRWAVFLPDDKYIVPYAGQLLGAPGDDEFQISPARLSGALREGQTVDRASVATLFIYGLLFQPTRDMVFYQRAGIKRLELTAHGEEAVAAHGSAMSRVVKGNTPLTETASRSCTG